MLTENSYLLKEILDKFYLDDYPKLAQLSKDFNNIIKNIKIYQRLLKYSKPNDPKPFHRVKKYCLLMKYGSPKILCFQTIYTHIYYLTQNTNTKKQEESLIKALNQIYLKNQPFTETQFTDFKSIIFYPLRVYSKKANLRILLHEDLRYN